MDSASPPMDSVPPPSDDVPPPMDIGPPPPGDIPVPVFIDDDYELELNDETLKMYKARGKLLQDFITKQLSYVTDLKLLNRCFRSELLDFELIDDEQLVKQFSNICDLIDFNENGYKAILKYTNFKNLKSDPEELGKQKLSSFIEDLTQFSGSYVLYCIGIDEAIDIHRNSMNNKKYANFVQKQEDHYERDMEFLLELPVTTMMSYPSVFSNIYHYTPEDHPDYKKLDDIIELFSNSGDRITQNRTNAQNRITLAKFDEIVTGYPTKMLLTEKRLLLSAYIIIGYVIDGTPKKMEERHAYLFTDSLILTKVIKKKEQFKEELRISKSTRIEDSNNFILVTMGDKTIAIQFPDPTLRSVWKKGFHDSVKVLRKSHKARATINISKSGISNKRKSRKSIHLSLNDSGGRNAKTSRTKKKGPLLSEEQLQVISSDLEKIEIRTKSLMNSHRNCVSRLDQIEESLKSFM
eukprot:TRINITY_DN7306_c0_g1_i1.p1 TRINITY_DN7306_c0_g1~~TRINITY_DN7306_c0_g1_i1.p1  ORF type:complete len:543 (+),score=119.62 TRINITY_DN7306_c0_g1_i1:235-1629(+)